MKKLILFASFSTILATSLASAGKEYQVTGPVTELTDAKIVVQKGKEKFEIARDPATKVKGNLAVGSKVTVYYSMTATEVEAKEEKTKK